MAQWNRMFRYTHSICDACWFERYPGKALTRITDIMVVGEKCCFCGQRNYSGLYVHCGLERTRCAGKHQ